MNILRYAEPDILHPTPQAEADSFQLSGAALSLMVVYINKLANTHTWLSLQP